MPRFDRYLLSQLMVVFGFFALVLVLVYWINRAVKLFEQLISDGQSAWVFLEFTALSLPAVIRLVLPMAAFVASIYVTNKLTSESELVVVQATGFSPYRLSRPVIWFGAIVALMMFLLSHFLVPLSLQSLSQRQAEITANATASLLKDGQFMSPTTGVTLFIREITPEGELIDLFLADTRSPSEHTTFTASQAYLVSTEVGPQLVMIDGMAQVYSPETGRLFTTRFDDFAYDLGTLINSGQTSTPRLYQMTSAQLLRAAPDMLEATSATKADFTAEFHKRTAEGLLTLAASLLGFACLLTGGFSRFGVWRQIIGAIFLVIVVKMLDTAGINMIRQNSALWPAAYASVIVAFALSWFLLFVAAHPRLFRGPIRDGVAP